VAEVLTYQHRNTLVSDTDSTWILSKCLMGHQSTVAGKFFPDELVSGQEHGKRKTRSEAASGRGVEGGDEKAKRLRMLFQKEKDDKRKAKEGGGGGDEGEGENAFDDDDDDAAEEFEHDVEADYTKDYYASDNDDDDDGGDDDEAVF
jgi:hypothetical protein